MLFLAKSVDDFTDPNVQSANLTILFTSGASRFTVFSQAPLSKDPVGLDQLSKRSDP